MPNETRAWLEVLEARPDWLTATTRPGLRSNLLQATAARWVRARADSGYRSKPFGWQGYVGETTDGISYGKRDDGTIIRLSGEMAAMHFKTAHGLADSVSRLDLQITVRDDDPERNWAEIALSQAQKDTRLVSGVTKWSMVHSQNGGATAYLGSRISDRYYRIYNKTAQSDGAYPRTSWRYEIEWKHARAKRVADVLRSNLYSPEAVRGIMVGAFIDYGIKLPAEYIQLDWRDANIVSESTDQRRYDWLMRCIAPCVAKLSESFTRNQILDALGLQIPTLDIDDPEEPADYEANVPDSDFEHAFIVAGD